MKIDRQIDQLLDNILLEEKNYEKVYNYIFDLVDQINSLEEEKQMAEDTISELKEKLYE